MGSPFLEFISHPAGLPPTSTKSSPVKTVTTPGIFSASDVSTALIIPFATSDRTNTA